MDWVLVLQFTAPKARRKCLAPGFNATSEATHLEKICNLVVSKCKSLTSSKNLWYNEREFTETMSINAHLRGGEVVQLHRSSTCGETPDLRLRRPPRARFYL